MTAGPGPTGFSRRRPRRPGDPLADRIATSGPGGEGPSTAVARAGRTGSAAAARSPGRRPARPLSPMGILRRLARGRPEFSVRADLACGAIALIIGLIAVGGTIGVHGGSLTVLIHMAGSDPISELVRSDPHFVFSTNHTDGVFFYAMTLDPLALGRPHELIDLGPNRYAHPGYSWAAWLVSFGRPELAPVALFLVSLGGLVVASVAASRISSLFGWSPWGGLVVAFNPGFVYAVTADTSEAFGAAVLTTAFLAWITERRLIGALLLILLCFCKEILVLAPVGLALWEGIVWLRGGAGRVFARRLLLLAPGPLLYTGWYVYVWTRFGIWPFHSFDAGLPALGPPLAGWVDALLIGARFATAGFYESQVGHVVVPLVAVGFVAILLGVWQALKLRSPLDTVYLAMAGLTLSMAWAAMMFPKEFIRNLSWIFLMLPAIALRPRSLPPGLAAPGPFDDPEGDAAATGTPAPAD